jgi:hypothetical protein
VERATSDGGEGDERRRERRAAERATSGGESDERRREERATEETTVRESDGDDRAG